MHRQTSHVGSAIALCRATRRATVSRAALLTSLLALSLARAVAADGPIIGIFNERPPYLIEAPDGSPGGLTGAPAARAFRAAGIAVHWRRVPTNRQLALLKEDNAMHCAIGWFHTSEREQFAKFSKPIYRDSDWVALAHVSYVAAAGGTLDQALQERGTRVLVKDKFSYGRALDAMLARRRPIVAVSTATMQQMAQEVGAGTVEFMFASDEEARYLIAHAGAQASALHVIHFRDMPRGETRHIMCGKNVPDALIDKLNATIGLPSF